MSHRKRRAWKMLDILNPLTCTKLHTVEIQTMHVGKAYPFWSKKKAIDFYNSIKESYPITTIRNEITGEKWEHNQWDTFYKDFVFIHGVSFDNELMKLPGGAF